MSVVSFLFRMTSFASRLLIIVLAVAVCTVPLPANAQEEEDPQQELPEIAPQEIEIRGELTLSFPSLQRQPLRGFETPSSIPSVSPDRSPFVEPYKQSLNTLPDSLPTPDAMSPSAAPSQPSQNGYLEMGAGRYLSRFAEGRLSLPLTSQQRLSFEMDYTGTDGFPPYETVDVETPADGLDGRIRFETRHDHVSFAADVHGRADRYTLYGIPELATNASAVPPDRSGYAGGARAELRTMGTVTSSVDLFYERTQFDTELGLAANAPIASFVENRLGMDGAATFRLGSRSARLEVAALRSSFGGDPPSQTAYSVDGGGSVGLLESDRLSVRAGARILAFESPVAPQRADSPTASATFIVPQGRAELRMDESATLYAENAPEQSEGTLADVYERNPYAQHAPSVRPQLSTTNAEAGLNLSLGAVRLQTNAGYRYAPSYRYFENPDPSQSSPRLFTAAYESARILHVGGQIGLQGIRGFATSVRLALRDGALVGDDADIPYFSPVVGSAMLSYSFANDRGYLQTTGELKSPRPTDPSGTTEIGTYVAFDVEGSYQLTSSLDAVVRIQNISPAAPKEWARYPRPPAMVMGGVRIRW